MKKDPTNLFILFGILLLSITKTQSQATNDNPTNPNFNQEFNPSFAIIIVILVAALFLMGFFSIYIRRCSDSPSSNNLLLPITNGRRAVARGLDPSVIETFPILEYSEVKIHKIGKDVLECAVCLMEFEDTETLRLIPKCDHVFHPECIDEWLSSHTTCPVCRANLVPQPGDSVHGVPESQQQDVEAQNDAVQLPTESDSVLLAPEVISLNKTLNRNRTRGSQSNRPRRFPRSHSTGHSLIQPGENTDRFTLKLPNKVRKQIMSRQLQRARSLITLPRESSSRHGYRTGGEGSNRGKSLRRLDLSFKSDRWIFNRAPSFLARALSFRSPKPKVNNSDDDEGTSSAAAPIMPSSAVDSARPQI
ncbi:putative transcription factor C2H2 family [Medicago truncatula]|uniref:RING-type E3 ubiquitin transferase n=2 Tax=Medicago truncatula TaxID=3880 RepID=Q2HTN3_MEDTR|nr:E3 ubiquitin-protein ligase ATL6 [Medicago truncatula]ABD32383.1 Zinc finger, RING-type [Medicago truncatula]AES82533.1 RING-H2 zinc finger protein [Medicago truncatula]RHN49303.1 putative transcription factor C2H2 family [Medicago truncatula]